MNLKHFAVGAMLAVATPALAQDNLVNSLKHNHSTNVQFEFRDLINLETTPVLNQGSSGTCWSYATTSFLESEMARAGRDPVDLSEIFSARCVYIEKGRQFVKMHGATGLGDGGALHDVIEVYKKYGALPQSEYTGLQYGTKINDFSEMASLRESFLNTIIKPQKGKLTPNWLQAYTGIIDAYLGTPPETFEYKGQTYTPQSFAREVVGLNPNDYIHISSFIEYPMYESFVLPVPDNWSQGSVYNVRMNELTEIIDFALENGYTVGWATDVSEKYFSWKNGVAFVPELEWEDMSPQQRENLFSGPQPERQINEYMRQDAFDRYLTTDDHGMHIVGIATDQEGNKYYKVKNSWGTSNDLKGFLYVTPTYVQFKTTAILLNYRGVPNHILSKLHL